jgi:hypothetical protein
MKTLLKCSPILESDENSRSNAVRANDRFDRCQIHGVMVIRMGYKCYKYPYRREDSKSPRDLEQVENRRDRSLDGSLLALRCILSLTEVHLLWFSRLEETQRN